MPWPRLIDFHTHLWGDADGLRPRGGDDATLTAMADRFGHTAFVVLPLFGGFYPSIRSVRSGNDAARDYAHREPRARPFVTVWPPAGSGAVEEAVIRLRDEGFAGVKVWIARADDPAMDRLVDAVAPLGRPILIHALDKTAGQLPHESRPVDVAALARRHPGATLVMAHCGGDFYKGCLHVAELPHVHVDISGSNCERGMVEHAVRTLGPDRVIYGTDGPGVATLPKLAQVLTADIDLDARDQILFRNAARLLGLDEEATP